ncbi:MAG: hypothetical protein ACREOB_06860 [Thermodesulfobacteriota bacterium]
MKFIMSLVLILLLGVTISTLAELPVKQVLTLSVAKKIADAAESEAVKRGATVVIAVVDDAAGI